MKNIFIALLLAAALPASVASFASAGELDGSASFSHGLIVRVSAQGAREVYKADVASQVENADDAVAANAKFLTDANRVAKVASGSELDRTSSSESWYYWYAPAYPGYYYYTYNYAAPTVYPAYTYSVAYYPTYTINAYGYQYYYYWYHF